MDRKREVAIHEAGHACVALLCGKKYACRIYDTPHGIGGLAGTGTLDEPPDLTDYTPEKTAAAYAGDTLGDLYRDAVITAAGCVAVCLAKGDTDATPTGGDSEQLNAAAKTAFPNATAATRETWVQSAVEDAARRTLGSWQRVMRVADELERMGRLTAASVKSIFEYSG